MKKETNLCMGCMEEKEREGECRRCGYADKGVYLATYLYPKTFLSERYIVGKLISYNGEAALYMGFDAVANKKVTIKEYMPDALCTREKDALALTVNHDSIPLYKTYLSEFIDLNRSLESYGAGVNIQRVLDVFTENNTAYTVYEYITGISLKTYLQNLGGTLTWEQAKELFNPIFSTLSIINAAGIVHRGISPQTVFVNERMEIRLIGFAISAARTFGSAINYEVFAGYAAPEQYNVYERQGSHTDVYGLSAVLYRALTGEAPLSARERAEEDTLAAPSMFDRNIPVNVSEVIMEGLILNPEERIKTVNDFVSRLFSRQAPSRQQPANSPQGRPSQGKPLQPAYKLPQDNPMYGKPPQGSSPQGNSAADSANGQPGLKPPPLPVAPKSRPLTDKPREHISSVSSKSKSVSKSRKYVKNAAKNIAIITTIAAVVIFFGVLIVLAATNPDLFEDFVKPQVTETPPPDTRIEPPRIQTTPPPVEETEPDSTIELVNLTGSEYNRAVNRYSDLLEFKVVYTYHDSVKKDYIIEQDTEPAEVKLGAVVTLTVSKGPEFVKLPDYTGKTLDDYIKTLNDYGIQTGDPAGEEDPDIPEGEVIRCNFEIGDKINISEEEPDTVIIYYSEGEGDNS